MNAVLVCDVVMWSFLLLAVGYGLFNKLVVRYFPKYAAKRQVKKTARSDRSMKKYQQKKEIKANRLQEWAQAHSDDPIAKALLAQQASSMSLVDAETNEEDFAMELRRLQQINDEYKQRRAANEVAEELHAQRLLDWAIENPLIPQARRHLEEQMEKATERLVYVESDIRHCQFLMDYGREEGDPESIFYATRFSEAQARQATEEELIHRIHTALTRQSVSSEEQ